MEMGYKAELSVNFLDFFRENAVYGFQNVTPVSRIRRSLYFAARSGERRIRKDTGKI
jgi:hypothetical protein